MRELIPTLDTKEKSFHGLLAVGALAGVIEGSIRYGLTLHTAFPGMLLTLLGELCGRLTVVMVSHDMSAVSAHATAVACVNRKVFYHDSAEIGPDAMEQVWGRCPVELVAHGIPHRVLAVYDHDHRHDGEQCSHD